MGDAAVAGEGAAGGGGGDVDVLGEGLGESAQRMAQAQAGEWRRSGERWRRRPSPRSRGSGSNRSAQATESTISSFAKPLRVLLREHPLARLSNRPRARSSIDHHRQLPLPTPPPEPLHHLIRLMRDAPPRTLSSSKATHSNSPPRPPEPKPASQPAPKPSPERQPQIEPRFAPAGAFRTRRSRRCGWCSSGRTPPRPRREEGVTLSGHSPALLSGRVTPSSPAAGPGKALPALGPPRHRPPEPAAPTARPSRPPPNASPQPAPPFPPAPHAAPPAAP